MGNSGPVMLIDGPAFNAAKEIGKLDYQLAKLRDVIKFVSTDPCFKFLGTVTQDKIKAVLIQD